MKKSNSFVLALALMAAIAGAGCSPIGMAAGAGASLGIAAAQEGGISSAATDLRIKATISEKWFSYKVDTFTKLNLTVDQGRVLITGTVQNPDDRVEAVRLAWQVNGVKQVINEIRVAQSEGVAGFVKDGWITTRLRTAITFEKNIQSINYSIDTVNGTVYLMGVARSQSELDSVISIARTIPNVKQVISYVKPMGQPVASDGSLTSPQWAAPAQEAPMQISPQINSQTTMSPIPAPVQRESLAP
jgi:osmotically-inducible protein OsmY